MIPVNSMEKREDHTATQETDTQTPTGRNRRQSLYAGHTDIYVQAKLCHAGGTRSRSAGSERGFKSSTAQ